jgi:hypothetical protein
MTGTSCTKLASREALSGRMFCSKIIGTSHQPKAKTGIMLSG